jgi:gamma-glutamylcysteine synthetase
MIYSKKSWYFQVFFVYCVYTNLKKMAKELTKERLALAIIKTTKEVKEIKKELEKVQLYLREQHKLKQQLKK